MGYSLSLLRDLGGSVDEALQARLRVPTRFLAAFALCLRTAKVKSAEAAAQHVANLVDSAVAAFHGQSIVHESVLGRNICLRAEGIKVAVSLIDFERSRFCVLEEAYPKDRLPRDVRTRLAAERVYAKSQAVEAVTSLWPILLPFLLPPLVITDHDPLRLEIP